MIRGHFLWLFMLVAAPGAAGAAGQAGRPALPISAQHLTLQQYVSKLDGSMAILSGGDPAASRKWSATLPNEWVVETEERSYHLKTEWLRAALEMDGRTAHKKNAMVEQAKLRLASLREAAQALQAPDAGEDLRGSHAALDSILKAREFRGARGPSYYEILRARTLGWIQRQLAKVFGRMRRSPTISGVLAWGLIAIAALLLASWAVRISIGSRVQIDLSGSAPVSRGWRDWLRDARTASALAISALRSMPPTGRPWRGSWKYKFFLKTGREHRENRFAWLIPKTRPMRRWQDLPRGWSWCGMATSRPLRPIGTKLPNNWRDLSAWLPRSQRHPAPDWRYRGHGSTVCVDDRLAAGSGATVAGLSFKLLDRLEWCKGGISVVTELGLSRGTVGSISSGTA